MYNLIPRIRGNLPLIKPEPKGLGVYQGQTSDNQGQGSYFYRTHLLAVDRMIYTLKGFLQSLESLVC